MYLRDKMRSPGNEWRLAGGDDATPYETGEGGVDANFSAGESPGESPAMPQNKKKTLEDDGLCRSLLLLSRSLLPVLAIILRLLGVVRKTRKRQG